MDEWMTPNRFPDAGRQPNMQGMYPMPAQMQQYYSSNSYQENPKQLSILDT